MRLAKVMAVLSSTARASVFGSALSLAALGCGGATKQAAPEAGPAQPQPMGPQSPTGSGESELVSAERELDDADARLSNAASEGAAAMSDDAEFESAAPQSGSASRCSTVCKAYTSLLRARKAICRIDGDAGPRCERANFTVERHENTRAACDCPKE
jgi:hypothetical protein